MNYTCWFSEKKAANSALVGEMGANLGRLAADGVPVAPGFCITVDAYGYLLKVTGLNRTITGLVEAINFEDQEDVAAKALAIRDLIEQQPIPTEIAREVLENYFNLGRQMGLRHLEAMPVVVRSSATVEDSTQTPDKRRLATYPNVRGGYSVLEHARHCWASRGNTCALTDRRRQGIDHQGVKVAVVIQAMIDPHDWEPLSHTSAQNHTNLAHQSIRERLN